MTPTTLSPPATTQRPPLAGLRRPAVPRQDVSIALVSEQNAARAELEAGISRKFETEYSAHLQSFLPHLLSLRSGGELGAVLGIRTAAESPLFLEQYLDAPVEQAVARAFRTPIDRDQIVEIGNLAGNVPGLAYLLFGILARVLSTAGYRWVACTATPQVEAMLARLRFSSQTICAADPSKLADGAADWGNYYASQPRVIVGDAASAAARVSANREMTALMQPFHEAILEMAERLRASA